MGYAGLDGGNYPPKISSDPENRQKIIAAEPVRTLKVHAYLWASGGAE